VISNVMGALLQALEITFFEMQRKNSNKKITQKRKKAFHLTKRLYFFLLWTPPIFKPHDFLIFYSFKII